MNPIQAMQQILREASYHVCALEQDTGYEAGCFFGWANAREGLRAVERLRKLGLVEIAGHVDALESSLLELEKRFSKEGARLRGQPVPDTKVCSRSEARRHARVAWERFAALQKLAEPRMVCG